MKMKAVVDISFDCVYFSSSTSETSIAFIFTLSHPSIYLYSLYK